ncbi:MAG: hypothetical protein AAF391_11320 [Bacteroidota bacterium]
MRLTKKYNCTHIPIEQRTTLYTRVTASEIFDANEILIEDLLTRKRWESFKNNFFSKANEPSLTKEIDRLDEYIKELPSRLDSDIKELENTEEFYKIEPIIEKIKLSLESFSCEDCKPFKDICKIDKKQNHESVQEGMCMERFTHHFNEIKSIVMTFYRDLAKTKNKNKILFSTSFNSKDTLHDLDVDVHANAQTIIRDDNKKTVSEVELRFLISKFDWNTYCSIPYMITHELVCHAFQDIFDGSSPRKLPSEYCYFTEGFVDRAALEILTASLDRKGMGKDFRLPPEDQPYSRAISRRAFALHDARRKRSRGLVFQGRNQGAQAFERLAKYLGGYHRNGSPNWQKAIAATLSLNAKQLSFDDRAMVQSIVHAVLLRPNSPAAAELLGLIRDLVDEGVKGVDAFIKGLRSLRDDNSGPSPVAA